ncbi:MAG TPA: BMP family ABC transporter substrate-binding protein [Chloroflexota bacterium]|jgi:basic membrane protein A|nr:BMP family ABC transporter substrate-binding protein [Chloroflexota bacterium]
MKRARVVIAALATAGLLATSFTTVNTVGAAVAMHATIKIGVVLDVGGVNDQSFNQGTWDGALGAADGRFGFKKMSGIAVKYVSTPPNDGNTAYYEKELKGFVSKGYKLIFTDGFAMWNAVWHVATANPTIHFAIVDGSPIDDSFNEADLPNVANLQFEAEQSGYLVGYIAGLLEKNKVVSADTGKISVLGGYPFPPVTGYMCGYIEGARYADPSIKVYADFDNTFTDQLVGLDAGNAAVGWGSSILFQVDGTAGLGYLRAALNHGVYGIGEDVPQGHLGVFILTSAVKVLSQSVYLTIKADVGHHFMGRNNLFSLRNKGVGYDKTQAHMPPGTMKSYFRAADAVAAKITAHRIKIYGPNTWDAGGNHVTDFGMGACTPDRHP